MKTVLIFLLIGSSFCYGQTDLNGIWADSNSTSFKNCFLIISQQSTVITISHYLEYKGVSLVEKGTGYLKNNEIHYDVQVTKGISGWATKGTHHLNIENEGNTLRGYYIDDKGNNGPLVFKRIKFE